MTKKAVFNLVFPDYCNTLKLFGYKFSRAENYQEALLQLHHRINSTGEFQTFRCTGGHAITAYVDMPRKQAPAVLNWQRSGSMAFSDILLLLSLFSGRDVFTQSIETFKPFMNIPYDQREYLYGGVFRCSIRYEAAGQDPLYKFDIGFENTLNKVYKLIRSKKWQTRFKGGNYLHLALSAFRQRTLEDAFLSCWTIWEHLFAVMNEDWLSNSNIEKMSAIEKLSFLLVQYAFKNKLDKSAKARLERLSSIRNRLVHYGFFPITGEVHHDAALLVQITEFLIAKTLDLLPTDVFNTMSRFEDFLSCAANPAQQNKNKDRTRAVLSNRQSKSTK